MKEAVALKLSEGANSGALDHTGDLMNGLLCKEGLRDHHVFIEGCFHETHDGHHERQ